MADFSDRRSERCERNAEQSRRDARDRAGHALERARQRGVDAIVGDETGYGRAQPAVFPHREIDPLETGQRGIFDRAVVEPVLELVREQGIPFFAVECLDGSGDNRFHHSIAAAIAAPGSRIGSASAMRRKKSADRSISSPR